MWPKLIDCLESNLNFQNKLSYLNTIINVHGLKIEDEKEITLVKNKIKEFCADVTKRTEGLLLLYAVVHCSSTLYVDNWSQIVLGSLKCPDLIIPKDIPLKILNRTLLNFSHIEEYKEIFPKLLSDIFSIILNPEDEKVYKLSCQSLAVCMRCVPELAGARVADIEKLLVKGLENPYGEIVEAIGECFAALPLCILSVPNSGPLDVKQIWCNVFKKLMNTMNSLLNNLMRFTEDQPEYVDVSGLPMFEIPSSDSDNTVIQIDIFKALCLCMAKMLSSDAHVSLPMSELLDSLYRIFSTEKIVKGKIQDAVIGELKLCFPQMLNGVYIVLEALILNISNFLEQSHNFFDIMDMSLNAMKETFSLSSSVSQVRGSTWKLINVWLTQYGSKGSFHLSKNKNIIQEILKDIDIEENENIKSKQLKNSNAKEENQKENEKFACTHALKVLKSLVETGSCFMEKNHLDKICSTLIRISKIVLLHTLPKKYPFPYSEGACRKLLFYSLFSSIVYNDPLHCKYIMEAQNIFNAASRDTNPKVVRLCHKYRKLCRHILNPRKPPPDAIQYSHPSMLHTVQQPVIETIRNEWGNGIEWNSTHSPVSDDQMDDGEAAQVQVENTYIDKMESENDLAIEQRDESEHLMNHEYRRIAKPSSQVIEEESIDDSDVEATYVSNDSNPQRINVNSPHINSFGMQPCVEEYANETRTERHISETAVVPNLTNSVENNIDEHVSNFVEVKSQKASQLPMGNGEWKKKENCVESSEEDSDMDEEGDEEVEANEDVSDNAGDEASDGKRSPEYDEERPSKRQKCIEEEGDEDIDEEVEDEEIPVNNQSSDEEEDIVNDVPVLKQNADSTENINEESLEDTEDTGCKSPTIRQMCGDFVLAEPSVNDMS